MNTQEAVLFIITEICMIFKFWILLANLPFCLGFWIHIGEDSLAHLQGSLFLDLLGAARSLILGLNVQHLAPIFFQGIYFIEKWVVLNVEKGWVLIQVSLFHSETSRQTPEVFTRCFGFQCWNRMAGQKCTVSIGTVILNDFSCLHHTGPIYLLVFCIEVIFCFQLKEHLSLSNLASYYTFLNTTWNRLFQNSKFEFLHFFI